MSSQSLNEPRSSYEDLTYLTETQEQERLQRINPIDESQVDCELSQRALYGYHNEPQKKKRSIQDHDNLLFHLTSKESSVRMSRLVVNTTRLIFSLVLLLNGDFNFIPILIADVVTTSFLVLWDFPETIDKSPYATVYVSSVVTETIISFGVLVVISLELVTLINVDLFGVDMDPPFDPTQTGF